MGYLLDVLGLVKLLFAPACGREAGLLWCNLVKTSSDGNGDFRPREREREDLLWFQSFESVNFEEKCCPLPRQIELKKKKKKEP